MAGRETSRRAALCLSFAAGPQTLDVSLVPGTTVEMELVFYRSGAPLRSLAGTRRAKIHGIEDPLACAHFEEAADRYAEWLAGDPWLERAPWFVRDCLPCRHRDHWVLRDTTGAVVPLAKAFAHLWQLVAVSGGNPVTVFGEWNGEALLPLSVFAEKRFVDLGGKIL